MKGIPAVELQTAVAVAVPVITFVVWLVRLEGRINGHDRQYLELRDDVRYIRERIDKALNGHD